LVPEQTLPRQVIGNKFTLDITTASNYKLIKRIKDKNFDVDKLHQYSLSIQIGSRDFQLLVVDTTNNQCLLLEDFGLAKIESYPQLVETLETIYEAHHVLSAGFWKSVKISIKNSKYSFVPATLFDKSALDNYLQINCKINKKIEELVYFKHINSDAVNIFAINKRILDWISKAYPNINVLYTHQASALIEGVLKASKKYSSDTLFIYVDRFKLHLITTENNNLRYYNQFPIKNFADYIKYIMLVLKGLGYHQKSTEVVISGYLGKHSPHFHEFGKFIQKLSFGDRPTYLKYGYQFDEVDDHQFTDLFGTYLCE
jgi:hypothetical protein